MHVGYILQKYTLENHIFEKYTLAQKSLVMVVTSLVIVASSLVMVATSLVMVATSLVMVEKSNQYLTCVHARDVCASKN